MGRNLKKEAEWARNKYERIYIQIDKELGKAFKDKIKSENKSVNAVIKEFVEKYVNE